MFYYAGNFQIQITSKNLEVEGANEAVLVVVGQNNHLLNKIVVT